MIVDYEKATEIAHLVIIIVAAAALWRSNQVKYLIEVQEKTINALKIAFEQCKDRLDAIEESRKNGN